MNSGKVINFSSGQLDTEVLKLCLMVCCIKMGNTVNTNKFPWTDKPEKSMTSFCFEN